jgi:uncharacterized protein
MQYRKFEKLNWQVSALGFGAMRLPLLDGNPANIDKSQTIRMIRYAIDHGINYVDTAYMYHAGESEKVVGLALKDGYRERVKLATKLPTRMVKTADDFDRFFEEQLGKLQTDRIDFYLFHALNSLSWQKIKDLGVLKWAESQMAKGRIGRLGFSFHDNYDSFQKIVDDYDNWTLCQVLYNYMDSDFQAGNRGIEYAARKGLSVAVMEPLRGGQLAGNLPERVRQVWESAPAPKSPVEWGLSWVWNNPHVSLVLSGMSTFEQVVENVAIAERSGTITLREDELALFTRAKEAFDSLNAVPCTNCGYCMPCPNNVEIPAIFKLYNAAMISNSTKWSRLRYSGVAGLRPDQRADCCVECGQCEARCPQGMPVTDWLKKVHALLAEEKKTAKS